MKITQQELIEFAGENDLQIFGQGKIVTSKIRALQRLIQRGLLPKPKWEGGTSEAYWENDTEIKDRIIWLDEQKKIGKSYRRMKEEMEPQKPYSSEELIVKDLISDINDLLEIHSNNHELVFLKAKKSHTLGKWVEALDLLKSLETTCNENKELLFFVYDEMAYIYFQLEAKDEQLVACNKLVNVAKDLGNNMKLGAAYCDMGSFYCHYNEMEKAFEYYSRAISLLKGTEFLGGAYSGMYIIQKKQGNFSEAEVYIKKTIEIFAQAGDKRKECLSKANLGMLCFDLGRLSEALKFLQESYHTMSKLHDLDGMTVISGNIGRIYIKKGLFSKAMEYLRHAYQLASQHNEPSRQARYLEMISEVYKEIGNNKKSEFYLKESKKIKESISNSKEKNNNQKVPSSAGQSDEGDVTVDD